MRAGDAHCDAKLAKMTAGGGKGRRKRKEEEEEEEEKEEEEMTCVKSNNPRLTGWGPN